MSKSPNKQSLSLRTIYGSLAFICIALWLCVGCSPVSTIKKTTGKIVRDIRSNDGDLKKTVGFYDFEMRASVSNSPLGRSFLQMLHGAVTNTCSNIVVVNAGDSEYPAFSRAYPKDAAGRLDNFALAQKGRELGFNAFVYGAFIAVGDDKKERGLLWWKDTYKYLNMQLTVEVLDSETGAKLMDDVFTKEIEIGPVDEIVPATEQDLDPAELQKNLAELVDEMVAKICDVVSIHPWRGFVQSVDNNKITISSGIRSGILIGDEFEVYDVSDVIKSKSGQQYFVPGKKAGTIKITAVYPHKAEGVAMEGAGFSPGSSIRPKE